jgi:hypothetical protein
MEKEIDAEIAGAVEAAESAPWETADTLTRHVLAEERP